MKIRAMNKVLVGICVVGASLLVALGSPIRARAQGAGQTEQGGQRGANILQHLTKALGLSADQQTQIGDILGEAKTKLEALRADKSLTREQRHEGAKAIFQGVRTAIRSDLNPSQQAKFDRMVANREARMQAHKQ